MPIETQPPVRNAFSPASTHQDYGDIPDPDDHPDRLPPEIQILKVPQVLFPTKAPSASDLVVGLELPGFHDILCGQILILQAVADDGTPTEPRLKVRVDRNPQHGRHWLDDGHRGPPYTSFMYHPLVPDREPSTAPTPAAEGRTTVSIVAPLPAAA